MSDVQPQRGRAETAGQDRRQTPADVTREPTGGQELREDLADALAVELDSLGISGEMSCRASEYLADAVLTLRPLAALLADAERVGRVREVADSLDVDSCDPMPDDRSRLLFDTAQRIRRALDGEPQP